MSDLLERLEKATGPNVQLDADIDMHFGLTPEPMSGYAEKKRLADGSVWMLPHYTDSIDAAYNLAEKICPEWGMVIRSHGAAELRHPKLVSRDAHGFGATPAIAICIAVLKAHEATHDR